MHIHVETRLQANYAQMLSTLIGQIISKLINDTESDINVDLFCVDKFTFNRVLELCTCFEQTKQKNTWKMSNRQLENASDDDLDFCL